VAQQEVERFRVDAVHTATGKVQTDTQNKRLTRMLEVIMTKNIEHQILQRNLLHSLNKEVI
jgi:hypothetical protein